MESFPQATKSWSVHGEGVTESKLFSLPTTFRAMLQIEITFNKLLSNEIEFVWFSVENYLDERSCKFQLNV